MIKYLIHKVNMGGKNLPETNMVPVKEQNCTISFRAETAIGQSSQ